MSQKEEQAELFNEGMIKEMFGLRKNHARPIGIDLGHDSLKLAQLDNIEMGTILLAGNSKRTPTDMVRGSSAWQKWAIETIRLLSTYGHFQGKEVIAAMPTGDVFIDHMKMPKVKSDNLYDAIFTKIKQKLPFESLQDNTMMQYIPTEEDNVLVMATERRIIDRHLAIYEKAGLSIKSIGVWPTALANCYVKCFGRRKSDLEAVVMLICVEADCTNVVICRHEKLLLARSLPIGAEKLGDEQAATKLFMELTACKRQFGLIYRNAQIERLIFLSGQSVSIEIYAAIAKQLEMPAQMGDCLAAVKIGKSCRLGRVDNDQERSDNSIDRRDCYVNWAVAFGLSLS
ncbi:MAG: pilus assembly protein PilM [Planctomycetota bacterium]|nr:pilus assembly protein PilM [Planctomycetota bacterium]